MGQPNVIELSGRIDNVTSSAVEENIASVLDGRVTTLILDFSAVTFVSSIGLRMLLMTAKRCRKQSVRLALHSVPPQIVDLFGLSGLNPFFLIYSNREAALRDSR